MNTAAHRLTAASILSCVVGPLTWSPVGASEASFLERFRGHWSGAGKVQREGSSPPRQVSCTVTGSPTENRISARGDCRAALIFRREIGVDLAYDPHSGTYRGSYIGSRIGPARLAGIRSGDALNLRIEWPRLVNGDTKATMVIQNDGRGILRIAVADNLIAGGPIVQTSELVLARR